jgi:mannose-6-phosphate isomerase-like protein (cupin superfamily)
MPTDYHPNLIGFFNLERLPQHDKGTMTQRLISGEKGMAVWSHIKAGTHTPNHSHHNEQIMLITAGRMDFRLQNETRTCLPGDMILIRERTSAAPRGRYVALIAGSALPTALAPRNG